MNEEAELEEYAPWMVIIVTLIGGFLRLLLLDMDGMWLDETFSVWLASQNTLDMLAWIIRIDSHPPLYYLLLHAWIGLVGDSPYDVRLLSALFGTATIPILYLIGKRLSGVVVGLSAALILAVSPFNIYYAQETRMYTLLAFNAAAAMYSLVRLLTDPRAAAPIGRQFREYLHTWRFAPPAEPEPPKEFSYKDESRPQTGWRGWIYRHRWLPIQAIETDLAWSGLIAFSALTMLSHNTAVLFPIAANVFVLCLMLVQRFRKSSALPAMQAPSLRNWVQAQVGILILWGVWLVPFIKQAGAVGQRFWVPQPTWEAVIQVLKSFLNASAPIPADQARLIWSLYGLVLGLGVLFFRKKFSQLLFLAVLFFVPILSELIVSLRQPVFLDRTLIWVTLPLFLLLAAGVAQFRFRFLIICVVGILGAINLFSAGDYHRFYQKEDWNSAAGYVALFAEKDDLILFNSNFVIIPFNYYFQPYEDLYKIEVEKRGVPQDLFESGILEPEMTADELPGLLALIRGHGRVWLVYSHDDYTDPSGLIPQALASQKKLIRTKQFYGGQVQLYADP